MTRRALLAAVALAVVVLPVALLLAVRRPPGVSGPPSQEAGLAQTLLPDGVTAGHRYSEALAPVPDALSEVAFYVGGRDHRAFAPLHLDITDGGRVVRAVTSQYRPPSDVVRFTFAPIDDSSHRALVAEVTAPGADDLTMVSLFVVEQPPVGVPTLFRDGQDTGNYAPLRLRYRAPVPVAGQLVAISDRASEYCPTPLKTPAPLLVAAATLALSALVVAAVAGAGPRWLAG